MSKNFETVTRLAKYIADFTYRAYDLFSIEIEGYGGLKDLDYDKNPECWGSFNGTITYNIFKSSFEITAEYPEYWDYGVFSVKIYSKKLGIDKYVYTTRELKTELKQIAEKLKDSIGSEGYDAFMDII